jgi:hypothetical protein
LPFSSLVLFTISTPLFWYFGSLMPIPRKYFLQALGHEGLNNLLAAYDDKTAYAVCTFAYCAGPGEEVTLFQGRTKGRIVPARGLGHFGMSSVFRTILDVALV